MRSPLAHEANFDPLLETYRTRADSVMVAVNLFLLIVCAALIPINGTFLEVLLVGLPTLAVSYWLALRFAGHLATRIFMACGFMAYTGLIIHQTGGDIEAHFSAFGLIGILLYYRDWRVIAAATVFIYLHHMVLGYAQKTGLPIYVFDSDQYWKLFAIHVAYFLPFVSMMGYLAIWLRREAFDARRVISLAQDIIKGDGLLTSGSRALDGEADTSYSESQLLKSVSAMRSRLVDLIRVLPVPTAVVRTDIGVVLSVNDAWSQSFADMLTPGSQIQNSPIWVDNARWSSLLSEASASERKVLNRVEMLLNCLGGRELDFEVSIVLHDEMVPALAIMTANDISLHRKAQQALSALAHTDQLTGLPNRLSFENALAEVTNEWQSYGDPFAVALIDLDGFKSINDTHGHDAGDAVLKQVAVRLGEFAGTNLLIARFGGDEFVLLLRNCPDADHGTAIALSIIDSLSTTMVVPPLHRGVTIGASIGIAHVHHVDKAKGLIKCADSALYEAKGLGRNQVVCFSEMALAGDSAA